MSPLRRTRPARPAAARRRSARAALARVARAALTCGLVACAACQRVGGPRVELQRMMVQPRYEPYGSSSFFRDGKSMQLPPAGTVAREDIVGPPTPPPADSTILALGREQYHVACAPCHGAGGFGAGMVGRNLAGTPGLALQSAAVRALTPAQLYARLALPGDVRHARAAELSPRERWAVALYTRSLLAPGPRPDAARQDSLAAAEAVALRGAVAAQLRRLNGVAP